MDYRLIDVSTDTYPNTFCKVDAEDFDNLIQSHWYVWKNKKTFYVSRSQRKSDHGNPKTVLMHREIMGAHISLHVDHINRDGLDNRRENLRICTAAQNNMNRRSYKNTSGFRGVTWSKRDKIFCAQIGHSRTKLHLGHFKNKIDAAIAYNKAAIELHGKFAILNIIPETGRDSVYEKPCYSTNMKEK